MRFLSFLFSFTFIALYALANETSPKVKHNYQSDVARLRRIVINSLYSHKEIFLRELISNANDALEKLRLTALTDRSVWNGFDPLNITIKAENDGDGGGRLIITDTGIGMTSEELTTNLGTLAKSGTSEFLARTEASESATTAVAGNLIGAFGLGFYSSFLVADRVHVASMPPKTSDNPEPTQYIFSSSADDTTFEIYPDPRGNTLVRGTEITLFMKSDALEYLEASKLSNLVHKHSAFTSSFPIYLFEKWTEEIPTEDEVEDPTPEPPRVSENSDDEAIVEEVPKEDNKNPPRMQTVTKEKWSHLNSQPPLWARDPKNITDAEYQLFYTSFFKDFNQPMAWHHFSGESDGVSFKGILFFPDKLNDDYWHKSSEHRSADIKLMVKRVFITSDLGEFALPQWASWVKVVVDADDLPLNVSRETLQSNRFLKNLKRVILKHMIQLFTKISEGDNTDRIQKVREIYGSALKLGAIEDIKNREKLGALTSFTTNHRNGTTFDHYLERRRKGQKQIFYLAEIGRKPEDLAESVFIEQLDARGYEVFLFTEPVDEVLVGHLQTWKGAPFQDAAKAGLNFGDEDMNPDDDKAEQKELESKFKPLTEWLKKEAGNSVRNVILSNRLVKSPCAVIADTGGYTANVAKLMAASNARNNQPHPMHEYAMRAKILEINPHSPLIVGLLNRVSNLSTDEDLDSEAELKEVASILVDGALIRSGYGLTDNNRFFTRIDKVLRRSLGVSEAAQGEAKVKPAPVRGDDDIDSPSTENMVIPDELKSKIQMVDSWDNPVTEHDEL